MYEITTDAIEILPINYRRNVVPEFRHQTFNMRELVAIWTILASLITSNAFLEQVSTQTYRNGTGKLQHHG